MWPFNKKKELQPGDLLKKAWEDGVDSGKIKLGLDGEAPEQEPKQEETKIANPEVKKNTICFNCHDDIWQRAHNLMRMIGIVDHVGGLEERLARGIATYQKVDQQYQEQLAAKKKPKNNRRKK